MSYYITMKINFGLNLVPDFINLYESDLKIQLFIVLSIARIYMKITQKTEKHLKLTQVYNEITSIKAQILNFMQPNQQPNTNTFVNINILPQNTDSHPSQIRKMQVNESNKKENDNDVIIKGAKCPPHYTSLKCLRTQLHTGQKSPVNLFTGVGNKNPFIGESGGNSPTLKTLKFQMNSPQTSKAKIGQGQFKKMEKVIMKTQTEPNQPKQPVSQYLTENKNTKFGHSRHRSQVQLNSFKQLNKSKSNQKLLSNDKSKRQPVSRFYCPFKKVSNTIKEQKEEKDEKQQKIMKQKTKRLMRMCSDFTDMPTSNSQKRHFSINNYQKIIYLQQELKKKDEIILTLSVELQEIEKNFSQMQASLRQILLNRVGDLKQVRESEVNMALQQIVKAIQSKRQEIISLKNQNLLLNQCKSSQQNKIKELQQLMESKQKMNEDLISFQKQKEDLKSKLEVIASKLEVAVNENKLKDEFIVNFLLNRNEQEKKEGWAFQTLQVYLQKINYPNNKLLKKLCQEEEQICKLSKTLQKLTKKETQY